jgi:hypothetical protein
MKKNLFFVFLTIISTMAIANDNQVINHFNNLKKVNFEKPKEELKVMKLLPCTISTTVTVNFEGVTCDGLPYSGTVGGNATCTASNCADALGCAIISAYNNAYANIGTIEEICPPE